MCLLPAVTEQSSYFTQEIGLLRPNVSGLVGHKSTKHHRVPALASATRRCVCAVLCVREKLGSALRVTSRSSGLRDWVAQEHRLNVRHTRRRLTPRQ